MRKTSKLILVGGVLAALAVPSAAMADGGATYTGQGFTDGALNNQPTPANDGNTGQFADWDGEGDAYDTGDGYILWVLSANGAKSATITLPDGTHDMIPVGGTFKYASPFYTNAALMADPPKASYVGTVKGSTKLTVSHGHAVDTNIPAKTWTTSNGGTVPGDFGTDPVFRYKAEQDRNYSWLSSKGNIFTSVQHVVQTNMAVDAKPIYGDYTGKIVGYTLTEPYIEYQKDADGNDVRDANGNRVPVNMSSTTRSGVEEGTCPDGGSFVKWVMWNPTTDPSTATDTPYGMKLPFTNNIKSGLAVNGEWLPTTV